MSGKIFFAISGGFLLGVFLHSLIKFNIFEIGFVFLIGASFLLLYFLEKRERELFIFVSLIIFSIGLGLIRYSLFENTSDYLAEYAGKTGFYEGVVTEEPEYREKSTHLSVSLNSVEEKNVGGQILVIVESGGDYAYGDRVQIFGELKIPESFETDSGRMFDYKNYLKARGIDYIFIYPKVSVLSSGEGNYFKEKIFAFKNKFIDSINQNIKAPESSLLLGLLLGVKESLGVTWENIFRRAGLSHIVVLSGYNLTIVAFFIMWLLSFLPLKPRLIAAALSITIFAIMTGGSATVVRASAMALLVIFADFIKRRYDVTRALVLAGVAMVLLNPKILVFDISFQLSFLATVGLIYISPIIEKYFLWVTEKFKFREIVLATISTQIFVTPFLLWSMGQFSIVSLFSNLLVLPLVPISMLLGFLAGLVGFISNTLAFPFSFITYILLKIELLLSKFFADLPFASISIPSFSPWWLLVIYMILILGIYYFHKKLKNVL